MRKKQTPLRRLSGMANWVLPKHSGLFDLEFDRYQSLRAALGPAMTDPFVLVVSLAQIVAYAYFFRTLLLLPDDVCNGLLPSLLQFAVAAVAVQLLWAVKAVYLFEKAAPVGSSVMHAIARIIRTTVITLPFSFIPAWVIGCITWPFLRINAVSGFRFYDQSLLIGQYVQNSMWYIGASQGGVRENLQDFSDITISSRSRYWDAASEAMVLNVVGMIVLGCVFVVGYMLGVADGAPISVFGRAMPNMVAVLFAYLTVVGVLITITNTCGIAALSILEFSRNTQAAALETDLHEDQQQQWIRFLPHALVGCVAFAAFMFVFAGLVANTCEPTIRVPPSHFSR